MESAATEEFDYVSALAACSRGDKQALQRIYHREGRQMFGVALRIVRQRQAAEDVLHDAFLNIWTRAASFDPARGSARAWLYSIVRHQALDHMRSGAREVQVDDDMREAVEDQASMELAARMTDAFELRVSLGKLDDCLGRLDSAKRNCILYAYLDGFSHSEIAERLNAPLGTVKAWIKRGVDSLRECMT